jgi:15-cis-phytoene synthase
MSTAIVPTFQDSSAGVLKKHATSFWWASYFLPGPSFLPVSELYHFCRYADEVADQLHPEQARTQLTQLRRVIEEPEKIVVPDQVAEAQLIKRLQGWGVQRAWMLELVAGVETDLEPVLGWSETQLLVYCYRVAGVVGLMMCPLIGVRDDAAYAQALDLGISMQLTNIARDIAEDAGRGRVYVPNEWLSEAGVSAEEILAGRLSPQAKKAIVGRLLQLSEVYYQSGRRGLVAIPFKPRLAIAIAARLYRAIGGKLLAQNSDPWLGRAHTSRLEKILLTLSELGVQLAMGLMGLIWLRPRRPHNSDLHLALHGLPEVKA